MQLTAFGRTYSLRWRKVIFWVFICLCLLGLVSFFRLSYRYYRSIKQGGMNPILEQQLKASVGKLRLNQQVTAKELARLTSALAPSIGPNAAKLTVVEFVDYSCPYSHDSAVPFRRIMAKYKDRVRFLVRDFPLDDIHPRAAATAIAARCMQDQGKFWEYYDLLFANQSHQEDADLLRYAQGLGVDMTQFQDCVTTVKPENTILEDMQDGAKAGVTGTPTFFFNGVKIQGGVDETTLEYLIKLFLEEKK